MRLLHHATKDHLPVTALVLTVALTAALLLIQDKNAPRYIQIYENEQ